MNTYDFIVIGSGAAGSVIAARLSENGKYTVLIVEAGHDNRQNSNSISKYQKELMRTTSTFGSLYSRYHQNPSLKKCNGVEVSPSLLEYATVKENTRFYNYPRGGGASGSTNHHAMVDGRGSIDVYNNIAKYVRDPMWKYKNILPYYKKMEKYLVKDANPNIHGTDGWLNIIRTGPLEEDLRKEMVEVLGEKFNVPYRTDPAEPDQVTGVYIAEVQNSPDNTRSNSFHNLLEPMLNSHKNITIKFNTLVNKIIIKKTSSSKSTNSNNSKNSNNSNDLKAVGIVVYEKPYIQEYNVTGNKLNPDCTANIPNKDLPKTKEYYAKKEVILCGGAINTPQILMLSGIGPKDELKKHGIKVKKDLPGVGQNYMDHVEATIAFELDPAKFMWVWQATFFKYNTNYKKLASVAVQKTIEKYARSTNDLGPTGVSLMWDWVVNPTSNFSYPDVHTHVLEFLYFDYNLNFIKVKGDDYNEKQNKFDTYLPDKKHPLEYPGIKDLKLNYENRLTNPADPLVMISFLTENLKTKATGSITLKNKDPRESPIIQLGLWKDEEGIRNVAEQMINLRNFMKTPEMIKYAINPCDYSSFELYPGTGIKTEDEFVEYIQNWQSFGHHASGTCKMGPNNDSMAVLNSKLKVRGVDGLRVVDASVFPPPNLHAYNPSRGIYMIAELMSDVIKSDYDYSC